MDERRTAAARRRARRAAAGRARAARAACRGSRPRRRRAGTPGRRSRRRPRPRRRRRPRPPPSSGRRATPRAHDLEAAALDQALDLARDRDRERELAAPPLRAEQAQEEEQRLLDGDLAPRSSTRYSRSAARSKTTPRSAPTRRRGASPARSTRARSAASVAVGREPVRRHRLDAERPEHERQHERGRRVAVVDDDPEAARADRLDVERGEQVLGVALPHAGRVARSRRPRRTHPRSSRA